MDNNTPPIVTRSWADEIVDRYRRSAETLACDRHARPVSDYAHCLANGTEPDESLLLEVDRSLLCQECRLIVNAVLGDIHEEMDGADDESIISSLLQQVHASDHLRTSPLGEPTEDNDDVSTAFSGHYSPNNGSAQTATAVLPFTKPQRVRVLPAYPDPAQGCATPLAQAAEQHDWPGVEFAEVTRTKFNEDWSTEITGRTVRVFVSTPYHLYSLYVSGRDWSPLVPLRLAPQDTQIVTRLGSRLYDEAVDDETLPDHLGGKRIAVFDATSTHAARLKSAAHGSDAGLRVVVNETPPKRPRPDTLYLVPMSYGRMLGALIDKKIDGFSTVEPVPSIARQHWDTSCKKLRLRGASNDVLMNVCCVAAGPTALLKDPSNTGYDAIVLVLFRSVCQLLYEEALIRIVKSSFGPELLSDHHDEAARLAAVEMLRSVIGDVDIAAGQTEVANQLVLHLVPDVPDRLDLEFDALFPAMRNKKVRPLEWWYDVDRIRKICHEAILQEFGRGDRLLKHIGQLKRRQSSR